MLTFTLTATLLYGGSKSLITSKPLHLIIAAVKDDLTTLNIIQPSSATFKVRGPGRVEFSWSGQKDSALHKSLEAKINPRSPVSVLKSPETLWGLSITGIEYFVQEYSNADLRNDNSGGSGTKGLSTPDREIPKFPYINNEHSRLENSTEVTNQEVLTATRKYNLHLLQTRLHNKGIFEQSSTNTTKVTTTESQRLPIGAPELPPHLGMPGSSETQLKGNNDELLSSTHVFNARETQSALATGSIIGSPSVDIPTVAMKNRNSVAVLDANFNRTFLLGRPVECKKDMDSGVAIETEATSSARSKQRSLSPEIWDSGLSLASRSSDAFMSFDFTSNTIMSSKNESKIQRMPSRSSRGVWLDQAHLLSGVTCSGGSCETSIPERNRIIKPLPRALLTPPINSAQPPSTSRSTDSSVMDWLLSELEKLRKERRAGQEKQNTILEQLRKMGAADAILKPMHAVMDSRIGAENETVVDSDMAEAVKARLRAIEAEIHVEGTRKDDALQELKTIAREGRGPFVVPALLEAFVSLSKLTTDANERLRKHDALTSLSGQDG
ncbi:hypothetical protein D9757_005690 [Collybiopsis confluens]|uniref:Uncharacterized protein n=1 Tax=Collybiopsis confluens TaxID=2823264 RepID=A0A8H5MCH0_9AGAR|nr:hypothetical protein D9757_005690 [Collybiopsis confluens]